MSDGLHSWPYQAVYEASNAALVEDFYIPSLKRATRYDRAAGYFRSSIYHLIAVAMSDFVLRGGIMRLVCSPALDEQDEETIRRLGVNLEAVEASLTAEIQAALADASQLPVVELLATLLECGALDIRIAYKADEKGIFHSKVGIFHDGIDAVSFEGSTNETYMAWEHNEERFKAFCTWRSADQAALVEHDQHYFDQLWAGERPSIVVKPLPEIPSRLLRSHALPDPEAAIERVRISRGRHLRTRQHPARPLQEHQLQAKLNWWTQKRGIIDHVTGGGKTVTALAIAREWLERQPGGSVLVLVPSDLLTEQWRTELELELGDLDLRFLRVGGSLSSPSWREYLPDFTRAASVRGSRIVIATMDSASTETFLERANVGDHTLMIVDEVHKVGSRRRRGVLELQAGGRLGLSATPERFGDPEGTDLIFGYFGPRLQPSFSIQDAQSCTPPRLVPYSYETVFTYLTPAEFQRHEHLTQQIATLAARLRAGDSRVSDDSLTQLKLQRASVLKRAEAKVTRAAQVLADQYQSGQRWILYCDNGQQLEDLRTKLVERSIDPMVYTSEMSFSKPDTLLRFERLGGLLLSIRCLDEGIDIPLVSHALILASSTNPREHIQRRGRVLRTCPGKSRATIIDTLVGPNADEPDLIFLKDIARATAFAQDATNRRHALWRLDNLRKFPDIDDAIVWGDVEDD